MQEKLSILKPDISIQIKQAITDHEMVFFIGDQFIAVNDPYSPELDLPEKFTLISIKFKGLKLKIINQDDLILWECHFGIDGTSHRDEAGSKGISDFKTFSTMYDDFVRLSELLEQFPVIKPKIIYAGKTNKIMYDFLKKLFPEIVLDDIDQPEDALASVSKGDGWRDNYFVFDTDGFLNLVDKAKHSKGFLDFLRKRKKDALKVTME